MWNELKSIKSGPSEIREFALTVGVAVLLLASIIAMMKGTLINPKLILGACLFIITGHLVPKLFLPLQKAWMGLATVIGFFVSRIFLAVFFYLGITPIGLLMRLTGNDILDEKIEPNAETYWKDRTSDRRSRERYENQY